MFTKYVSLSNRELLGTISGVCLSLFCFLILCIKENIFTYYLFSWHLMLENVVMFIFIRTVLCIFTSGITNPPSLYENRSTHQSSAIYFYEPET